MLISISFAARCETTGMEFGIVFKYLILRFIMDTKNNHQINNNFFLTELGGESKS